MTRIILGGYTPPCIFCKVQFGTPSHKLNGNIQFCVLDSEIRLNFIFLNNIHCEVMQSWADFAGKTY